MRIRRLVLIAGSCLVIAAGAFLFTGSVVLFDPKREVASSQLIDGLGNKQPLLNLAYLHVGIPRIEGAVQIACKNGSIVERGYVTPGAPMWQRMDGTGRCSTIYL